MVRLVPGETFNRHLRPLAEAQADVADFSVVNDRPPEQVADEVIARATG